MCKWNTARFAMKFAQELMTAKRIKGQKNSCFAVNLHWHDT